MSGELFFAQRPVSGWKPARGIEIRKRHVLNFLKKHLSVDTRSRLRAYSPAFLCSQASYSQLGEDLLVAFVLDMLLEGRATRYLDVGANHPFLLSNTALLYKKGGRGLLVEPDPRLARRLRSGRPRDTVLQIGVHFSGEKKADFFVMDSPTLSTFSRQEMERYLSMGHRLIRTIQVELRDINSILDMAGPLDFMNIDIEGMDLSILEMVSWDKYRPACICVETLTYERQDEPKKRGDIVEFMVSRDYVLFADTFINSIFVERRQWREHWVRRKTLRTRTSMAAG
jgi:FkbM family methyltransferase